MDLAGASFLKRGASAFEELKNPTATPGAGGIMRFFLKYVKNDEAASSALLTFLDGSLVPMNETKGEIVYDAPGTYEHSRMIAKAPEYFMCTLDVEGQCPCCDDRMGRFYNLYLSIIDHRTNKSKSGRTFENNKRIFAINKDTLSRFNKMLKRDIALDKGLFTMQIVASKLAEKSSSVGDFFEFKQYVDIQTLANQGIDVTPLDFEKVLGYRSADQLRKLGFGGGKVVPVGVNVTSVGQTGGNTAAVVHEHAQLTSLDDEDIPF